MQSILAMTNFVEDLSLDKDPFGHCEFSALVEYSSSVRNATDITTVKFIRNGYDDGKIQLTEGDELNTDNFHMDFTPDHQVYVFDSKERTLVVTGRSGKMGGDYTVKIKKV